MLEIEYKEQKNQKAEILRCFGNDSVIRLPEELNGNTVVKVGDYAFSSYKKKEEEAIRISVEENLFGESSEEMLCGNKVKEVYLAKTTEEIGRYAFYGCVNLETLGFSDALLRTGTGIFTGCKLKNIRLDLYHGKKSALKDIVMDTRFLLQVQVYDHMEQRQACLIFPEYYEEAVENTPARIVENHFHGTGYRYRQCFFRGEFDYRKYDELFAVARVREDAEIVRQIVFGRLLYPYELTETAKEQYLDYVRKEQKHMISELIEKEELPVFYVFSEENIWTKESLEYAIDVASGKEKTGVLSILMDEQNRRFPKKRKVFEL